MDLHLGLAADVIPKSEASRELHALKIQLLAWVSFSRGNDCVSGTEVLKRPSGLPTIIL